MVCCSLVAEGEAGGNDMFSCTEGEGGSTGDSAEAAIVEPESSVTNWRWRIMSLDILPGRL